MPLGVFLMRSFYMDLPEELADAARVEGATSSRSSGASCSRCRCPGVAVLAVLVFFQTWNNFVLPLCTCKDRRTRCSPRASTCSRAVGRGSTSYIAAGSLIMIVPVVIFFLIFQRFFVRGLTSGALKG